MSNLPVTPPRRGLLASALLLMAFLGASLQAATTITIRPDSTGTANGDAFVSSTNATNNYGGAGALAVTANLSKGAFDSLIRMDLASAKAGFDTAYGVGQWTVTSVLIELSSGTPNNAIFNSPNTAGQVNVLWFGTDAWTEGAGTPMAAGTGVTWNDVGTLTAGSQSMGNFAYNTSGIQQYTLNPSTGFLTDVANGAQTSLWLRPGDSTVSALFNARSFGTVANRPALIITASALAPVPEPSRALLLMLGSFACLMRRRKPQS